MEGDAAINCLQAATTEEQAATAERRASVDALTQRASTQAALDKMCASIASRHVARHAWVQAQAVAMRTAMRRRKTRTIG
jgi:hypothetical protein